MFQGNKLVLILPGILMIVMFIGGYQFLKESDTITNEELQNVIELNVSKTELDDGLLVEVDWDWPVMPSDGLYGEDYIGISFTDENSEEDLEFKEATLELIYADQVIKESSGTIVNNGVIFEFPTKIIDHTSYGNTGKVRVIVKGNAVKPEMVRAHLLHTWTEHSPLNQDDATFASPTFQDAANVPHWIISR